jgi:hypothetical protein
MPAIRSCAASRDGGFGQRLIKWSVAFVCLLRFISIERESPAFGYGAEDCLRSARLA